MATKYSVEDIAEALRQARGFLGPAAKILGCGRTTLSSYIKKTKRLQQLLDELKEENIDLAETKLLDAIERGEAWAITFFLKTQAKHRGYVERQEFTGADGTPFVLKIVRADGKE